MGWCFQISSRSLAAQVLVQLADIEGAKFSSRLDAVLQHFSLSLDAKFDPESVVPIIQSLTRIVRLCQEGVTKRLSSPLFEDIWGIFLVPCYKFYFLTLQPQTNLYFIFAQLSNEAAKRILF